MWRRFGPQEPSAAATIVNERNFKPMFDSDKAAMRLRRMWLRLAGLLEAETSKLVERGYLKEAIQAGTYAEACFWKATGETDMHDIKDVLPADKSP